MLQLPQKPTTDETSDGVMGRLEPIPAAVRAALRELLRAHTYAQDLGCDVWQFATEIDQLRQLGLANNDLRWMLGRQWVDHAYESTRSDDTVRLFQPTEGHRFSDHSCFILTSRGVEIARAIAGMQGVVGPAGSAMDASTGSPPSALGSPRPHWDRERGQLYFGHVLVKEFRLPSPNQTTILTAFEEEEWPPRIDDPLPGVPGMDAKERLRFTIKSLNRHQKQPLIRFSGDGTGQGVRWEPVAIWRHDKAIARIAGDEGVDR